jgi:L-serine dehydratase
MTVSLFDLFKIGLGPSSSHTVGPMRAAGTFVRALAESGRLPDVARVAVDLYGSLALTGRGHGTDKAVLLGLAGETPEAVDPDAVEAILGGIRTGRSIALGGAHRVPFEEPRDLLFRMDEVLPHHPNALRFRAFDAAGAPVETRIFYSVGGGFVIDEADLAPDGTAVGAADAGAEATVPFPFPTGAEMLRLGRLHGKSIAEMVLENERTRRDDAAIFDGMRRIWSAMRESIERGLARDGMLPGGLAVRHRAKALHEELQRRERSNQRQPHEILDWVSLFAIAVNEENAAGGRIVTAPTNGAAGVVPAVLRYYVQFCDGDEDGIFAFLLTATAIGGLLKRNASISGAEVGCQGEVGAACAMAAAGLAAALGGSNEQIENAAEIGMEHHLGMTCDPIGGLVQIPCIERNAMGAVKAINAASLALRGDGAHRVPLDAVIETMRQTGRDMMSKYKETAQGGLAVNVPEC